MVSEPLPYKGITLSLEIAALQTGHVGLMGRHSSHWCKHGQLKIKANIHMAFVQQLLPLLITYMSNQIINF